MKFRAGGLIVVENSIFFIESMKKHFLKIEIRQMFIGTEMIYESDNLDLFIKTSDDLEYNIDLSGNNKIEMFNHAKFLGEVCKKLNAKGFISFIDTDFPSEEVEVYSHH